MKNLILFIFILFSKLLFSQASGSADFSLNINFDKKIPVDQLLVFCYTKSGNRIESVELKVDKVNNSINISGRNDFIIPVSFPILYFLYTEKVKIDEHSNQELEKNNIFYLVTGFGIKSYNKNINHIIKFSKEEPNILITSKNENGNQSFHIENFEKNTINQDFQEAMKVSNTSLKLN